MPLNQVISFGYWVSVFVQIYPGQLTQGGNYNFFSNYGSTYELIGLNLFDANDSLITDWTLLDAETGGTVFTPEGRTETSVSELGTLAIFDLSLVGPGAWRNVSQASRIA